MLLFVLCTMCVLQAAEDFPFCFKSSDDQETAMCKRRVEYLLDGSYDLEDQKSLALFELAMIKVDSQVTFPSLTSEDSDDEIKDAQRMVRVVLSPLQDIVSHNIEDLNDYLQPLPLFEQGVQFDDVVIEFGDQITQAVVNATKIRHQKSSLALLYKELAKKDLKKMLKDKAVVVYSTEIYDKMCQDQQLIAAFSKAFNVTTKYKLSLEERVQAWKGFRLCAGRVLSDLRKEQLPKIQTPQSGPPDVYVYIDQFLNINNDIVLTKKQQKQYTAYHVILCAVRQIHRKYDATADDEKSFSLVSA